MAKARKAPKVEKAGAAHPAAVKTDKNEVQAAPTKVKKSAVIFTGPSSKLSVTLFPKIYRFITERWKIIAAGAVSGIIIVGIVFQSVSLYRNLQEEKRIQEERGKTEKEIAFWEKSLTKYKDSRDIYLKIASLAYRLGNTEKARESLRKALEIDPNSKEAREMEKQIGL